MFFVIVTQNISYYAESITVESMASIGQVK